jgi:uncharacterized NAD-dependent epimerase/dehydratase family protein
MVNLRRMVILTEGYSDTVSAKTAVCLLRYCPDEVVGILDAGNVGKTAQQVFGVGGEVPVVAGLASSPAANTLVIGIAPSGGRVPPPWRALIREAIERGMNVISGLHEFLGDDAQLAALAAQRGVVIHDVRRNNELDVATGLGIRDDCLRLLTVGQDCSIGKMVVALELARALQSRGEDAMFVATGQTGIMISGEGCPIDRVISDFLAGAVEKMLLRFQHHKVLVFEGQGSISHPKYSAVTLGLMHGARPQGMILCYEPGRTHVHGMDHVPLRPLAQLRTAYESIAALVSPSKVIAVAANTRCLDASAARQELQRVEKELSLPACDVIRDGPDRIADVVVQQRRELLSLGTAT